MQAITNFYELQSVQLLHQKEHKDGKMVKRDDDYSCRICYPPSNTYSLRFKKFMTWCTDQLTVETFSMKTLEAFHDLINKPNLENHKVQEILQVIIESFTYRDEPRYGFDTMKYLIQLITQLSERFTISLEETRERFKKYYSETLDTEYETSPEKSSKTTSEKSSPKQEPLKEQATIMFEILENEIGKYNEKINNRPEEDDYKLFDDQDNEETDEEIIINTPEIIPHPTDSSESSEVNNSTNNSRLPTPEPPISQMAKIIKYTTYKGNESEDPIEWINNFERAAKANKLADDDRLNAVIGLLQDEAVAWYENIKVILEWISMNI